MQEELLMESLTEFLQVFLLSLLGVSGIIGLVAIASPQTFAVMAAYGGRSITGKRAARWFDGSASSARCHASTALSVAPSFWYAFPRLV